MKKIIAIIGAVLLVAAAGLGLYLLMQSSWFKSFVANPVINIGHNERLDIVEWHLRVPIPDTLKNIFLSVPAAVNSSDPAEQTVILVAPELDKVWICPVDTNGNKGVLGELRRTTGSVAVGGPVLAVKKVGNYYYSYHAGLTHACTTSAQYTTLVKAFRDSLPNAINY
jgi:hypothetical protein